MKGDGERDKKGEGRDEEKESVKSERIFRSEAKKRAIERGQTMR